jgi:anhydro-N-acetylmuramic acid kinase
MPNERLILGAMSGTSADGVDVALTHITGRGLQMQAKLLAHAYHPYSPELRKQILEMRQRGAVRLSDLADMGRQVTLAYVEACKLALKQGNVSADQVAAIAAHGQTLFHSPPNTIQYFDPSLLAYETGIAVVSDFRRADLAAGGQGAPLVPFADWILFRHPTKSRVILNIGGIANITYLKAGGSIDEVIAFDTGPGNCISDWLMREGGGVDSNGSRAMNGKAHFPSAFSLARSKYVFRKPPKSTDGPEMIEQFTAITKQLCPDASLNDLLATAAMSVAQSVKMSLELWVHTWRESLEEIFVAGGGVHNAAILKELATAFEGTRVAVSHDLSSMHASGPELGAAREALAFALLGAATLDGEPSNVPSATGASRRVVLGSITPKP